MTKEESYQRVPLLPLSHTNVSDPSIVKPCAAGVGDQAGRSSRGRRMGALVGSVLLVLFLWGGSLRLSWAWARESALVDAMDQLDQAAAAAGPGHAEAESALAVHFNAVDFDIEGPANFSALAQVCNRTEWVSNRWFSCDRMEGGIGNIRDEVLTCLRYAIAGGAGLVMPSLRLRGEVAIGEEDLHTGGRAGMDFYFDVDFLKHTLATVCPRMPIADSVYHIPSYAIASMPDVVNFKDIYTLDTGKPNGPDLPWPGKQRLKPGGGA